MPKIKTHKGASKRFIITPTGKIKRGKAFSNHMLEHKSQDQKRNYRGVTDISPANKRAVKKMLGVG
jgi:large subunit ribosomal protein L35